MAKLGNAGREGRCKLEGKLGGGLKVWSLLELLSIAVSIASESE